MVLSSRPKSLRKFIYLDSGDFRKLGIMGRYCCDWYAKSATFSSNARVWEESYAQICTGQSAGLKQIGTYWYWNTPTDFTSNNKLLCIVSIILDGINGLAKDTVRRHLTDLRICGWLDLNPLRATFMQLYSWFQLHWDCNLALHKRSADGIAADRSAKLSAVWLVRPGALSGRSSCSFCIGGIQYPFC